MNNWVPFTPILSQSAARTPLRLASHNMSYRVKGQIAYVIGNVFPAENGTAGQRIELTLPPEIETSWTNQNMVSGMVPCGVVYQADEGTAYSMGRAALYDQRTVTSYTVAQANASGTAAGGGWTLAGNVDWIAYHLCYPVA